MTCQHINIFASQFPRIYMNFFTLRMLIPSIFLWGMILHAERMDKAVLVEKIEKAYDFDPKTFALFDSDEFDKKDAMQSFIAATASYWIYQADRIDKDKKDRAEKMLCDSIDIATDFYRLDKKNPEARFLLGVNLCNRARFYVEESSWFRAFLDAREGLGVLRDLMEEYPDYADAGFAVGVAECFLSDAPAMLKPLASLLGFRGSAADGIQKLKACIEKGEWTRVEAEYYLGYYYYNVANDGENATYIFSKLSQLFPGNPLFGYLLGRAYQISHLPLEALVVYQRNCEVAVAAGADDIADWSYFRSGTILQGEHRYKDALIEYGKLQQRITSETHHQEYFYLLPLKTAECLIEVGDLKRARAYLGVIRPEWDRDTYRRAKDLLNEIGD